jgi:hypothetical protein
MWVNQCGGQSVRIKFVMWYVATSLYALVWRVTVGLGGGVMSYRPNFWACMYLVGSFNLLATTPLFNQFYRSCRASIVDPEMS